MVIYAKTKYTSETRGYGECIKRISESLLHSPYSFWCQDICRFWTLLYFLISSMENAFELVQKGCICLVVWEKPAINKIILPAINKIIMIM